jgi:hypothetical protein
LTVTNFGGAVGPRGFYRFDITPCGFERLDLLVGDC